MKGTTEVAVVVKDKDGTFAVKKLSKYDMAVLEHALYDAGDRRGNNGYGERMIELAQLVEDSQEADLHGVYVTKERSQAA